jgi:hypothetical protein
MLLSTPESLAITALNVRDAIDRAPVIERTPARLRMTSLDSAKRLKLDELWELTFSTYQDVLRDRCDVAALNARGLVGLAEYVELEVGQQQLRFPQPAELHTSMCTGTLAADGGYVLLGSVALHASATHLEQSGRMRILSRLVKPGARLGERAVRVVPPEMAKLASGACTESPSMQVLSAPPVQLEPFGPHYEDRIVFGQHDTDAYHFVYAGAYMSIAQARAHAHAVDAGLPLLTGLRLRASFKRAFVAGQACHVRTQLFTDGVTIETIVTFHTLAANGGVDLRPAVLVRIDWRALNGQSSQLAT